MKFLLLAVTALVVGVAVIAQPAFEPAGPSSRRTPIAISEIMFKPAARPDGRNTEFIELYNSNPWPEDVSGYRLAGQVDFVLPAGTTMSSQGYLVVAANPADVQAVYGLATVYGPYTNSLQTSGEVRLHDEQGTVLLDLDYDNFAPWPMGADGTGHSIVLARASYGEADARAWERSELAGGSPGAAEVLQANALRNVVINEVLAHTDLPQVDSIELYNHSAVVVNLSGCTLSDEAATNKFTIPGGTAIPARGFIVFTEAQLGFGLDAAGETIYFKNPAGTQVLDALHFAAQENGISLGRYPNGANEWYRLSTNTFGTNNATPRVSTVGFNEIMYRPLAGGDDQQYIELYNHGNTAANLGGWKLGGGISYTFPTNTTLAAKSYLVVGRNVASLLTNYVQLNATNTYGNFGGKLSGSGERLTLTMPDDIVSTNSIGALITNNINIVVDEVTYGTGGRWGRWSDGGGSSLELIDARSNKRLAGNWADSDETAKAPWTTIEATGVLDNGSGGFSPLQIGLLDAGECLVDDVEAINASAVNGVGNGGFESGMTGLAFVGSHSRSSLEAGAGFGGSVALRVRTADSIAMGPNNVQITLTGGSFANGQTATLRFKARWQRGSPEPLLRFWGDYLEAAGRLTVPANLGTPGLPNSQVKTNTGPAIYQVRHDPAVPAADEPVVVTARVADPDGLATLTLQYRFDPLTTTTNLAMNDVGINGDAIAGDGVYSATLPGRPTNAIAFVLIAADSTGATNRFPELVADNAPVRECVVYFGEPNPSNLFGTYHMWLTQANVNRWTSLPAMSNEDIDGTLVYNGRVIYNMGGRYSGSPFHQNYNGPSGTKACHYVWSMPTDDRLLGYSSFNKIHWPGNDIQNDTITNIQNDPTLQREQAANMFLREVEAPWMNRRLVAVYVNGVRRGKLMEDSCRPTGGGVKDQYFADDTEGQFYKIQRWYEGTGTSLISEGRLQNYTTTGGAYKGARYRPVWALKNSPGSLSDFSNLYALMQATTAYAQPGYVDFIENVVDVENWMRVSAVHHAAGDWDCFGSSTGQNADAWISAQHRWTLFTIDFGICLDNNLSGVGLFSFGDTGWSQMFAKPKFQRIYYRALNELVNGIMQSSVINPILDAKYAAMTAAGVSAAAPTATKNWIANQRNSIISAIASGNAATFALFSNSFVTATNSVTLTGTAPVEVISITINGVSYTPTWTTLTGWSLTVPVATGTFNWTVAARDRNGNPIGGSFAVSVQNTGVPVSPVGNVVINEIMFQAATPDAEYVELFNRSTTTTFDLSGWTVNGLDYTFPTGTTLPPQKFLVLAKSSVIFAATYSPLVPVFGTFGGNLQSNGETLSLIQPGLTPELDLVVDRVRFEATAPWPVATNGRSLQLVDAAQDNSRVDNWAVAQPGGGGLPPPIPDLLPLATVWSYQETANLDGLNWMATNYNDSLWPTGAGVLAFENNSEITPLINTTLADPRTGPGLTPGHAVYFRTKFVLPDELPGYQINATGYIDDGAIIYVNGDEVVPRLRMPAGPVTNDQLASGQPNSGDASPPDTFTLPAALFHAGTNYLAVEVHQVTTNSSDVVFGLKLDAEYVIAEQTATPGAANSVATTLPAFPTLWLNEVQAENLTGPTDNFGQHEPWLELFNPGPSPLSLSGYYLGTNYSSPTNWAFPAGATIAPGQFLVVWLDGQPVQTAGSVLHTSFRLIPAGGGVALARLVSGQPQIVDYLNYQPLPANYSYGDFPDGQPFYRESTYPPTPAGTNNEIAATITVSINEWMAENTGFLLNPATGKYDDWFELYNPSATPADLTGYYLTDNLGDPFQYQIPAGYVVPAHGFLLVWADDEVSANGTNNPALHVPFKLSKSGEALGLFAPDGSPIGALTFGVQTANISEGRYPDAGELWISMPTPSPAAPNILPPASQTPTITTFANKFDGSFQLEFPTEPGHTYRVEYKFSLNDPIWLPLGTDHFATTATMLVTDSPGASQRFYRVQLVQ